jgi:uncharacterized protein (TIGR02996 family)
MVAEQGRMAGEGSGATYCVFLAYYDSGNFDLEGGGRFDGVRLPDLIPHLSGSTPTNDWPFELRALRSQLFKDDAELPADEKPFWSVLREDPQNKDNWSVYRDWLEEHGDNSTSRILEQGLRQMTVYPVATICNSVSLQDFGLGSLDSADQQLQQLVEKVSQNGRDPSKTLIAVDEHFAQMCLHTDNWGSEDLYHQWIFFDDLWASANANLANAILRFANRWDVLSAQGGRQRS